MHTITVPNKFVRIQTDGKVWYSSRMTVKANCPMRLENFPMDTQNCPLEFGSCKYMSEVRVIFEYDVMIKSIFVGISYTVQRKHNFESKFIFNYRLSIIV